MQKFCSADQFLLVRVECIHRGMVCVEFPDMQSILRCAVRWFLSRHPGPLPWREYPLRVVAPRAEGARRLRRFGVGQAMRRCGDPICEGLRTVKRPEGRALTCIFVGALNTYLAWGEGTVLAAE